MKKTLKQFAVVVGAAFVILAALWCGVDQAFAGSNTPVEDATTNVVGVVTATSSNVVDIAPVPSGVVPLVRRFKVTSGTLTFLGGGSGSTTNVSIGGAGTNTFISAGTLTFSSSDGWVTQSSMPTRDRTALNGYSAGTLGGAGATGYVTGTVTTATIHYWITGRASQGPSTPGGYR